MANIEKHRIILHFHFEYFSAEILFLVMLCNSMDIKVPVPAFEILLESQLGK